MTKEEVFLSEIYEQPEPPCSRQSDGSPVSEPNTRTARPHGRFRLEREPNVRPNIEPNGRGGVAVAA
jgi:hypothetical protein